MKGLSVAGTAAMFLVGGGILTHGVPLLHRLVEDFGEEAADIPAVGAIVGPLAPMLVNALAGVVAGAAAFAIVAGVKRLRARGAAAT
jgi:predicted DNA repair protein MutK